MNKSWVSGGRNSEAVEKLREQVAELEGRREELLRKNGKKILDWALYVLTSPHAPKDLGRLRDDPEARELRETVALYERLNQQIMDKEASIAEKLDEQTRYDSLG